MSRRKQNALQVVSNNDSPVTLEKSKLCKVKYEDLKNIQPKTFNQRQFFELYNQLTSKPAVTSDPETTSPIKEIAPKKDGKMKKATSLKDDTSKESDEDDVDL